jgi:hypothetical protein
LSPSRRLLGDSPIPLRPHGIGTLRVLPEGRSSLGDAVVKVGDSAARAPLIQQLKVETRVPGEGVFAAS